MVVLEKLADFIKRTEDSFIGNEWLSDDKMQVYVRKGHHMIGGKIWECLDIANVEVYKQRQGTWTGFIFKAHEMNPWDCTYVECVHNPILASWLLKNGFLPTPTMESFYLPKNWEKWNEQRRARIMEARVAGEGH